MYTPTKRKMAFAAAGLLALIILGVTACSGSAAASTTRIRPTWINPTVTSTTVGVLVSDIDKAGMTHFRIATPSGQEVFMAYKLGDTYYVRASICPPCRSQSFSLVGDTLVCDTCGTVFNATTGAGISGACVRYPKQPAAFQTSGGTVTVTTADLINAYNKTLAG